MRKDEVAGSRGVRHTSEKKRKETTCAERRGSRIERGLAHVREEKKETTCAEGRGGWIERGLAHVREEKEENDVCGRTRWPDREGTGTRQRRKGKKRRVRRDEVADERGGSYLPRKKKARSSQEKQEKGRNI